MEGQRLNPFQHALERPDTYIGNIETLVENRVIFDENDVITNKDVAYNNGLFNIIREIGSNCIDNKWRSEHTQTPMKCIKVEWKDEDKTISFYNDGVAIPVEPKTYTYEDYRKKTVTEEEMYPAEMFFGEFLSGTNFGDKASSKRKTSGRNGMGAKCTNVFSKVFIVEHFDPKNKKIFKQQFSKNAKERTDPEISSSRAKIGWTKITFRPDFKRFGYSLKTNLEDFIGILKVYVCEMAGVTGIPVTFLRNGESIKYHYKTFDKYVKVFHPKSSISHIESCYGDECVIVENDSADVLPITLDTVQHVAFVNGLKTKDGGIHVEKWKDAIFPLIVKSFNSKVQKGAKASAKDVYPYLKMYLRTEIDKPKFNSQTKDILTGPEYLLHTTSRKKEDREEIQEFKENLEKMLKKIMKWKFVNLLSDKITLKSTGKPEKSVKRVSLGDKAVDANEAGKKPEKCTLYIAEGLSAKAMVRRGISSIDGQDYNGVFAIQGKPPNAINTGLKDLCENKEFSYLMTMLNLKLGVDYSVSENFKTLRYSKVIVTSDMDDDGIHIRGLLLLFFYHFWPQLIEENYIKSLSTSILKITCSKKQTLFYSLQDYELWKQSNTKKITEVKYYKGLGSINPDDVPGYFHDPKIVSYILEGDEIKTVRLAFDKDNENSDVRKQWIIKSIKKDNKKEGNNNYIYEGDLSFSDFIRNQLIIYSKTAVKRAIPCIIDGLKKCQRKVLYAIISKNYTKSQKLGKISGVVLEVSGYHHGSASLYEAIRKMALRYTGSNNIPLLEGDGEFGTRIMGGKDHAQPRYVSTKLEDITKSLYPRQDDILLEHEIEDNEVAEYSYYVPIICMILVNGADGIATGFSSKIPNYNPLDIVEWQRSWINDEEEFIELIPWYRGYDGEITLETLKNSDVPIRWRTKGVFQQCSDDCKIKTGGKKCRIRNDDWWHITDLPIGIWTSKLEEELSYLSGDVTQSMKKKGTKKAEDTKIVDFKQYSSVDKPNFIVKPSDDFDIQDLKCMQTTYSLKNMTAIDRNGIPRKYETPEDILNEWCPVRLEYYEKRRNYIIELCKYEHTKVTSKYKYIKLVIDKELDMYQDDEKLEMDMIKHKLEKLKNSFGSDKEKNYDYLLSMQMRSMTVNKLEELQKEVGKIKEKLKNTKSKTAKQMWIEDLDNFEVEYKKFMKNNPFK